MNADDERRDLGDDSYVNDRDQHKPDHTEPDAETPSAVGRVRGVIANNPIRTLLAAIVIGALICGGIAIGFGAVNDSGNLGTTGIGEGNGPEQNALTESTAGDCLDWPAGEPGQLAATACEEEHRFEVAGALDTSVLPGAEFGEEAAWPGPERFSAIRDEQCSVIVDRYLDGRFDPQGRFAAGLMYPSEAQWLKGARELRCGLELKPSIGVPDPAAPANPPNAQRSTQARFSGEVGAQDQSFQWVPGTCIGIDPETRRPAGPADGVDCATDHAFQTTGTVDLAQRFGDRLSGRPWPDGQTQNEYLGAICNGQAERFLGGKENLDATTLNVQSSILSEPSWLAGSRKVVCYLGLPDRGGFATLAGDAREGLLINGQEPEPQPQAPPGRALPTPVPLPEGVEPNPMEVPAPAG